MTGEEERAVGKVEETVEEAAEAALAHAELGGQVGHRELLGHVVGDAVDVLLLLW